MSREKESFCIFCSDGQQRVYHIDGEICEKIKSVEFFDNSGVSSESIPGWKSVQPGENGLHKVEFTDNRINIIIKKKEDE